MGQEKVSVIIPTYNRSGQIKQSIESVLRQTHADLELLVVDDASTDDTQAVVEAVSDERVTYIKLKENQGAAGARNAGARQASCPLIAFQDSDDVWRPRKLERQMAYLRQHPEYDMIYCPYRKHIGGQEIDVPNAGWRGSLAGRIFPHLALRNSIGAPTMLLKKDCFLALEGFATDLEALEDWEFALRFSLRHEIGYVDEVLVDSYDSPDGVSSNAAAYYGSLCKIIADYREPMQKEGVFDAAVGELFARAQRRGILELVKKMLMAYLGGGS